MPFSRCNGVRASPLISRRGLLCGGAAGFISTVAAAIVGSERIAGAQTRGGIVEVDRLAIRIVTDNIVRYFVPSQKLDDISIERMGGSQTPEAPPRTTLAGEWGLSIHAESYRGSEVRRVLVDFGYTPEVLLNNLEILKIDPAKIDALVLSHGHYDHFGGLLGFLKATKGKRKEGLPFFAGGEDSFCVRATLNGGQFGALDRKAIADSNLSLMMPDGAAIVADHAFTTGIIAESSFEKPIRATNEKVGMVDGFGCSTDKVPAVKNTGTFVPDDFEHEIATNYVVKGKGLVVLTSCSHRGVINTIRQAQAASGVQKVHAVIGGFHLVPPLTEDYYRQIIAALKDINPDYLMPGHCTGETFYDMVRQEMPKKVVLSNVGTLFTFGG